MVATKSEIFFWSDMLDPNLNASKRRGYYYHVLEVFYGSWEHIPKDLIIVCWSYRLRKYELLGAFGDLFAAAEKPVL